MEKLVEKLKEMGLNGYEAKVYLSLLKNHPATGYEISKESGVPQARAYDTLKTLETRKIVVSMGEKPVTYVPVAPNTLLERWEREFVSNLGFLKETLPSLNEQTVEPVLSLQGGNAIFNYACSMIDHAVNSLFLELWPEDAERLSPNIQAAKDRGIPIRVVGYDNVQVPGVEVFQHGLARTIENSLGGRWLIIAADDNEGLVGSVPPDGAPQAVYTRNPGLVLIIKELVVHDIFLLDVEEKLQPQMEALYGKNLKGLRARILGEAPEDCGAH